MTDRRGVSQLPAAAAKGSAGFHHMLPAVTGKPTSARSIAPARPAFVHRRYLRPFALFVRTRASQVSRGGIPAAIHSRISARDHSRRPPILFPAGPNLPESLHRSSVATEIRSNRASSSVVTIKGSKARLEAGCSSPGVSPALLTILSCSNIVKPSFVGVWISFRPAEWHRCRGTWFFVFKVDTCIICAAGQCPPLGLRLGPNFDLFLPRSCEVQSARDFVVGPWKQWLRMSEQIEIE